jgi:hypothetical protein
MTSAQRTNSVQFDKIWGCQPINISSWTVMKNNHLRRGGLGTKQGKREVVASYMSMKSEDCTVTLSKTK